MIVSYDQVYNYLRTKYGLSEGWAKGIMANIATESPRWDTEAVGDGGWSYGLMQWHDNPKTRTGRWTDLRNYARLVGKSPSDWKTQIDFAMLADEGGYLKKIQEAGDKSAEDATYWWAMRFERMKGGAASAEARKQNLKLFNDLGDITYDPEGLTNLDSSSGMTVYKVGDNYYAVGPVGDSGVFFELDGPPADMPFTEISASDWTELSDSLYYASSGEVLGELHGKTWDQYVQDVLDRLGMSGSAAMDDPTVLDVVARFLARPDMGESEFENLMRTTDYWKNHTARQLKWNDLSPAEQEQEILGQVSALLGVWSKYTGQYIDLSDFDVNGDGTLTADEVKEANPDFYQMAYDVASGGKSDVQVNFEIIDKAADMEGSPEWRRRHEEEKQQHAVENERENWAATVKKTYAEWGVPIDDNTANDIAKQLTDGTMSEADMMTQVKDQAQGLYAAKPYETKTLTWAQPYMNTYKQLMEKPDTDLFDNRIQDALQTGMTLGDFRKSLKQSEEWLYTSNARTELSNRAYQIGRMMGFE